LVCALLCSEYIAVSDGGPIFTEISIATHESSLHIPFSTICTIITAEIITTTTIPTASIAMAVVSAFAPAREPPYTE
jgi:hypothetical protein